MVSVARPNASNENQDSEKVDNDTNISTGVQSYLIANYRDALRRGDKSAAKSCLLAARYFSVNDPNVTNEIYQMAKTDGDISEASKCFANIFNDLFANDPHSSPPVDNSNESLVVIGQMKEEIRLLLNELKLHTLKLKSAPIPTSVNARPVPSVSQSPMLSPRLRMSSEDRAASRDSMGKLDSHLHSTTKSLFYQQLFEQLPDEVKRSLLDHCIETCDNPFERCRLMIMTILVFHDSVSTYGNRLLRSLIELSEHNDTNEVNNPLLGPRLPIMCQYAKSLLVLDAIPLVFNVRHTFTLEVGIEELYERSLNLYSESCLEAAAAEYEFNELHEGLKKTIAARILGKGNNLTANDNLEENIIVTLDLIGDRFLNSITDQEIKSNLEQLRAAKADKSGKSASFERMIEIIRALNLEDEIPDDVLFSLNKDDSIGSQANTTPTITPPPKGRGRPKKSQQSSVIVSPDSEAKKQIQQQARVAHFVFFSVVQHMFVNSAIYLRQTQSRILLKFDNPLAAIIESDLCKSAQQKTSRSRQQQQQNSEQGPSPSKKIKIEAPLNRFANPRRIEESPLNSEQSKLMDREIMRNLKEAQECLEFLNSGSVVVTKLWNKFLQANNCEELRWFSRVSVDSMFMLGQYDALTELLERITSDKRGSESEVRKDYIDEETSKLTVMTGCPSMSVNQLRSLTQLIACHVQMFDKIETFQSIEVLLTKIKQTGLLTNDENYSTGNIMDEYMVLVKTCDDNQDLGFLFFDALSIVRFVIDILMDILKRQTLYLNPTSDTIVGHTIVLSQFDWPKEAPIYDQCILWLRSNKPTSTTPQCLSAATKFTYPEFFHFVLNPNIIEDFMALLNIGYTLDIKSVTGATSLGAANSSQQRVPAISGSQNTNAGSGRSTAGGTPTRSGKAITTRGVNKSFKEELKVALTAQMKISKVLVPLDALSEFITTSLLPCLSSTTKK